MYFLGLTYHKFFQGVWGSAFSILFNRLNDKNKDAYGKHEDIREEMEKEISKSNIKFSSSISKLTLC